jgi:hypothetical protein
MGNGSLKKSLYQAFKKALESKRSNSHATQHIVRDILDPNMMPEVPSDRIPAKKENVLNKDMSISEMHQQKQAQAEAQLGMPPKMSGPKMSGPKMPSPKMSGPKMPGMNKVGHTNLMMKEEKGVGKLRKFMEKCSMKKSQKQK